MQSSRAAISPGDRPETETVSQKEREIKTEEWYNDHDIALKRSLNPAVYYFYFSDC